ncbi:MAG: RidA family protein [Candidatus Aureabacteria bacterium]|nr:RidA family protein [Candidatus Auribacterota bacterium]NLW93860.1 RidA family protein [Chlamydiota bacterium]HQM52563.1 RidA family protein [bacterium]
MTHTIVGTDKAPRPSGPYSQAVRVGNLLFISGQIPLDPRSGEVVAGGIDIQARRALENLGAILHAQGLDYPSVVKTTVFLRRMEEFKEFNEIYARYFASGPPARSCIEVSRLPGGVDVEIEAVAAY